MKKLILNLIVGILTLGNLANASPLDKVYQSKTDKVIKIHKPKIMFIYSSPFTTLGNANTSLGPITWVAIYPQPLPNYRNKSNKRYYYINYIPHSPISF